MLSHLGCDGRFLYVPFSHIHTPQYVAPRNAGRSGKTGEAGHFYDTLMEMDETVGSIMAALSSQPAVDSETLVWLTGDNGASPGTQTQDTSLGVLYELVS